MRGQGAFPRFVRFFAISASVDFVVAGDTRLFVPRAYEEGGSPMEGGSLDISRTTCGQLKTFYKNNECCGSPGKVVEFDCTELLTSDQKFYWTQAGLEAIPFDKWEHFDVAGEQNTKHAPNFHDIPFPGDEMTIDMLASWKTHVEPSLATGAGSCDSFAELLRAGYVSLAPHAMDVKHPTSVYFYKPAQIQQSPVVNRIQFANEMGRDLSLMARKGRLQTSADLRLREHYYRFPDQCDAVPIAIEVHLRLMLMDQVEAFYRPAPRVGLWQELFPDVERRAFNQEALGASKWFVSKYAEGYMHTLTNGGYVYPFVDSNIEAYMLAVGLDPADTSMDHSTPQGLGNYIGKKATEWLQANDGLQKMNDWVDVDGLRAIKEYHAAKGAFNWTHWEPLLAGSMRYRGIRPGIVTQQTFVSPSNGVKSFLYMNDEDFEAANFNSVPPLDMSQEAYAARADDLLEVLAANSWLTDYQKGVAELANNKIWGSLFMIIQGGINLLKNKIGLDGESDEYIHKYEDYSYVTSNCEIAATHVAWRSKRTYYAGRPSTVIPELYKRDTAFAAKWGEKAQNFMPYIKPGDHPEYVSGSSVIYSSFVVAADHWFAKNYPEHFSMADGERASEQTGEVSLMFPAGSWDWSDGPAAPVTVKWPSLWAWVEDLPRARMYAGVHFREAGEAGIALGKWVGKRCFEIQEALKHGDVGRNATWTAPGRTTVGLFAP